MARPFEHSSQSIGPLGRVLRSRRVEVVQEIETILAQASRVRHVDQADVWGACAERGIDLRRKLRFERKGFYRRFLEHCFADKSLSLEETEDLEHLRQLLHLNEADVDKIHDEVARSVYGKAIQDVLEDLKLDEDEELFLRRLRRELELPEEVAERLYTEGAQKARLRALSAASSRDRSFLEHRGAAGDFVGRSTTDIEDAVTDALAKAAVAIPSLDWFEVIHIAGYTAESRVSGWHVSIRAGIRKEG